ncbi:MAG TPA: FAD-dependent oxidoreductase [Euzebyales bacterium]|nr:FAD-dependent oxidoreductase [Euzebyales bacterium]
MNPVLLLVIEDAGERARMTDELASRFARDYAIEACSSARAALERLLAFEAADAPVAMVLADVDMWSVDSIAFLVQVRGLVPTATRILLHDRGVGAAGGDVRRAVALGRIDSAVSKPTGPRDEDFFGMLTEYLADWAWITRPVVDAVKIVGSETAVAERTMVDILRRHAIPAGIYPPDSSEGRRILDRADPDAGLPVVEVLDAPPLSAPSLQELADQFGFAGDVGSDVYDLVVIGAGPAGLGAAVYAASEGLDTLVIEHEAIGGQAGTSSMIRNYLGFPRGVTGRRLAVHGERQATRFGASFHLMRSAVALRADDVLQLTVSSGVEVASRSVLLSCGVSYRRLGVASLEALVGAGVFYGAALGEAAALEGLDAFVVGAGNSAGQAALHLARYAARVTLVVRGPDLGRSMSDYLIRELRAHDRIEVLLQTEVVGGGGSGHLERLTLRDRAARQDREVPAAGLFILIGAEPHTDWLPDEIERDERGFVRTGGEISPDRWPLSRAPAAFETSMPGVFAAGDVRAGSVKRVAAAAGEGAVTVPMIHRFLTTPPVVERDREQPPPANSR